MAIKSGNILHLGNNQFIIDRLQSAGVPNINIPRDRIFELGNYRTVGNVRDIPDLGFTMDSYDVTTELPALLTGNNPATTPALTSFVDFADLKPIDIVSPFKAVNSLPANGVTTSVRGVAVPFLFLESVSYRFGVSALTSISYSLRGDGIYYIPGTPYVYTYPAQTWVVGTVVNWLLPSAAGGGAATAIAYNDGGVDTFALSVVEIDTAGIHTRKIYGTDYTDTAAGIKFTAVGLPAATSTVRVVYGSASVSTYTETGAANANTTPMTLGQNFHPAVTASTPAANRGRFVEVYVGLDAQATPKPLKFTRVQAANVNWRVNLERDEEFSNHKIVNMDYNDTPEVSGQFMVKAQTAVELTAKIQQATNTTSTKITGPVYNGTVPVEIKIKSSVDGSTISGLYIPNASFDVPGFEQRVQQKNITSFNFFSEDGVMQVYNGDRPGS